MLLIACANVANLMLARAAVASSANSPSIRLLERAAAACCGQLLTESVMLASLGSVASRLVLGSWGVRALLALVPGRIPRITGADGLVQAPPLDGGIVLLHEWAWRC